MICRYVQKFDVGRFKAVLLNLNTALLFCVIYVAKN